MRQYLTLLSLKFWDFSSGGLEALVGGDGENTGGSNTGGSNGGGGNTEGGNEKSNMSELENIKKEALNENAQKKLEKEEKKGNFKKKFWDQKRMGQAYNMAKLSDKRARKLKLRAERFKKGFKASLGPLYKIYNSFP